jgi:hypothetical protein
MIMVEINTYSVDTPADLEFAEEAMKSDLMIKRYMNDLVV